MTRPLTTALFAATLILSFACGGLDDGTVGVGDEVRAARGVGEAQQATVLELYGKLARLRFADGETGWVEVESMEPPGVAPESAPAGDTCAREIVDTVMAPRGTATAKIKGMVSETYGKMAHIVFLDEGEMDWAPCAALELVEDEPDEPPPAPTPTTGGGGGGGGVSAAVTKCQRGCNSRCNGAKNKSKCVADCRRDCAR